jgi:hypothetical protein
MKTTKITCKTCNKTVAKSKGEIDRQKKRGRIDFYCGLKCAGQTKKNLKHLKKFKDNFLYTRHIRQKDEHSGFRWYMKNIKRSSKKRNHTYDVDIEYLEMIWKKQEGICPFTKEKLQLKTHSDDRFSTPYSASIDRIDNSKGYIKGNIRFVALIFNYARNVFTDEEVLGFCKKVASNA